MLPALKFIQDYNSESQLHIGLPVSPIFDLITTTMIKDYRGVWQMNGGLMPINALAGGNNTQKTGRTVSDIASLLYRFPKTIVLYADTESTLDLSRLGEAVDRQYGIEGYFEENILGITFIYMPQSDDVDGTTLHNRVLEIFKQIKALEESKEKEDRELHESLFFETPWLSKKTGQRIKERHPILVVCDSISEVMFDKLMFKQFDEGEMDEGGKKRTRDMEIGNLRRILMTDVCILGPRCGIRSYWIAQSADVINMDGKPKEKESTFLRHNKKLSAPKAMMKLPHIGVEIIKGTVLKQPDQSVTYPRGKESQISANAKTNPELVKYYTTVFRNKSGASGGDISFIGSQELGILPYLSMYDTLKEEKYWGLNGNNTRHQPALIPDLTLTRPTVRDMLEGPEADEKLRRAVEILYQMWFQQTFWDNFPQIWRITPQELYDLIDKNEHITWDEILSDTVYFWHDNPEFIKQHTLTIFELMEIAVNGKKPYWKK